MKFTKMHGIGNDYVYVNGFVETIKNPSELAIAVSDRHFGIGSDGLIIINPSDTADCEMEMYNADGSRGEMCGNGIRCVAKFVYDKGIVKKDLITVETLAGIKTLKLNIKDGVCESVRVDMGAPILEPVRVPVKFEGPQMIYEEIIVEGKTYRGSAISMGNPHFIIFLNEDITNLDLEKIGPGFENHEIFPNRVNTEFVNIIDKSHLAMRVWERGSGETLACGTGACAVAVAAILNGHCENTVDIKLLGGHLTIQYDREKNTVYMTGPATTVFEGEIN